MTKLYPALPLQEDEYAVLGRQQHRRMASDCTPCVKPARPMPPPPSLPPPSPLPLTSLTADITSVSQASADNG